LIPDAGPRVFIVQQDSQKKALFERQTFNMSDLQIGFALLFRGRSQKFEWRLRFLVRIQTQFSAGFLVAQVPFARENIPE